MRRRLPKKCRQCQKVYSGWQGDWKLDGCCCRECLTKVGPKYVTTNTNEVTPQTVATKAVVKTQPKSKKWRRQPAGKEFYKCQQWLELRYDVLKQYGRVCMLCAATTGSMHVDHIVPRSVDPSRALTFSNLQVLCRACNLGKGTRDCRDYRPLVNISTEPQSEWLRSRARRV